MSIIAARLDGQNQGLLKSVAEKASALVRSKLDRFLLVDKSTTSFLENWCSAALWDLIDCEGFRADPQWLSRRLKISFYQAECGWRNLVCDGLVREQNGKYVKVEEKLHLSTKRSLELVRRYHKQMMQKVRLRGPDDIGYDFVHQSGPSSGG